MLNETALCITADRLLYFRNGSRAENLTSNFCRAEALVFDISDAAARPAANTVRRSMFSIASCSFLKLCTTIQSPRRRERAASSEPVFAKLDRLTRNVDLLRSLVATDVDLVFCDLPSVPPGPMGKFLLTQMAAVAELEAGLIGERTKKALAAAKARGVKLGNPNGARALRGKQTGNAEAVAKIKEMAAQRAIDLQGIIERIKHSGVTSVRAITDELNHRGIRAPRGGTWHPTTVARLLNRL
jgi:hypothetical protein